MSTKTFIPNKCIFTKADIVKLLNYQVDGPFNEDCLSSSFCQQFVNQYYDNGYHTNSYSDEYENWLNHQRNKLYSNVSNKLVFILS
jgi:hypothetical protein